MRSLSCALYFWALFSSHDSGIKTPRCSEDDLLLISWVIGLHNNSNGFYKKRSVYDNRIPRVCVSEVNIYAVDYIYVLIGPKCSVVFCDRCFEDLHFHNKRECGGRKERREKKQPGSQHKTTTNLATK